MRDEDASAGGPSDGDQLRDRVFQQRLLVVGCGGVLNHCGEFWLNFSPWLEDRQRPINSKE
jgi:hypothetical protein